jgi:hypothetical protein
MTGVRAKAAIPFRARNRLYRTRLALIETGQNISTRESRQNRGQASSFPRSCLTLNERVAGLGSCRQDQWTPKISKDLSSFGNCDRSEKSGFF